MRTGLFTRYIEDAEKVWRIEAGVYLYDLYKEYYDELPEEYSSLPHDIACFLVNNRPGLGGNYKAFSENWKSEFLKAKNNDENVEEFLQTINTVYLVKIYKADCIKTKSGEIKFKNKEDRNNPGKYMDFVIKPGPVDFPKDDPMFCHLWSPSRGQLIPCVQRTCIPDFTKYEEEKARRKAILRKAPIIGACLIGALAVFGGAYYFFRGSEPKEAVVEETSSALPFRLITEDRLNSDGYLSFSPDTVGEFGYKILAPGETTLTEWPQHYTAVDREVVLRPQKSMRIAVFGRSDDSHFAAQEFNFDYPAFVEAAILSDRHEFLGPLLNNTGTHPLTIDYGGGIVERGEEINDDVLRTRVRRDLTVDSVATYWYDPDLTSEVYSPLKYIRLKRRK